MSVEIAIVKHGEGHAVRFNGVVFEPRTAREIGIALISLAAIAEVPTDDLKRLAAERSPILQPPNSFRVVKGGSDKT